jgi:L-ribulose-5-phosphate 3-epimerase
MRMNRRQLLRATAMLPAAARLHSEPVTRYQIRAGLVAYSYRKELGDKTMTYPDIIRMLGDWGIDGLDCTAYWFPDTSPEYLASLRKAAFKSGVQIYNAGTRVRLCQPTPDGQAAQVEEIKKWVDVADRLGASHIRVFGGNVPKDATEEQAIGWAVETMKRGAEISGSRGITLGVEDDGGLTTAARPTIEIAKRTASPWAGINADSGNLRVDGYNGFESMVPYATSVHLKTHVTVTAGKPEPADWPRLLEILGKSGYKGYVGLEYEDQDNSAAQVPGLMQKLRQVTRQVQG